MILFTKYLEEIKTLAKMALKENIRISAGHGLNYDKVKKIISIQGIEELNIGHFIIGESIFFGLENVILKMINIIKCADQ